MLKIRLQRVGRKNDASFRVIVTESTKGPKAGNAVEVLGFYDPKRNVSEIKADRVEHWMSVGAQASDTVRNLLVEKKIIKGKKVNVLSKKNPIINEVEADLSAQASEAKAEDVVDAPAEEIPEEKTAEIPVEETSDDEKKEETPAGKALVEEVKESVEEPVSAKVTADKEEKKEETK